MFGAKKIAISLKSKRKKGPNPNSLSRAYTKEKIYGKETVRSSTEIKRVQEVVQPPGSKGKGWAVRVA
jgi:hypothetical protein